VEVCVRHFGAAVGAARARVQGSPFYTPWVGFVLQCFAGHEALTAVLPQHSHEMRTGEDKQKKKEVGRSR